MNKARTHAAHTSTSPRLEMKPYVDCNINYNWPFQFGQKLKAF